MQKKKIYFAGGWFTPEQDEQHTRIYNLIKDKYDVFNPRLKGEIDSSTTHDKMSQILIGNVEGIQNADIVVVLYDFRDTGTIWESGFAYANHKPIIYVAENLHGRPFNLMLAKTGQFAGTTDELLKKLNDESSYIFKDVYNDYSGDVQ